MTHRTTAKTQAELLADLAGRGFHVSTREHPPLHTVAESQALRGEIAGRHTKNLFLRDKKGNYFLVTVGEDAVVDLKTIHTVIGAAGRVSFGSAEALEALLGLAPGAVTPFGVVNDEQGKVTAILDEELLRHDLVNAHPLVNTATTSIRPTDLIAYMRAVGHEPAILKVAAQSPNQQARHHAAAAS